MCYLCPKVLFQYDWGQKVTGDWQHKMVIRMVVCDFVFYYFIQGNMKLVLCDVIALIHMCRNWWIFSVLTLVE